MRRSQQRYSRNRYRKKYRDRPILMGFVLILVALGIVTAFRMIPGQEIEYSPSYGAQISAAPIIEDKEIPIIHQKDVEVGTKIDEYKGIAIYSNGKNYMSSHGLNFSEDGYYYGYKWQCVEFVKRFYYEKLGHEMTDGAGNAKYFFNPMLSQGEYNDQRGLIQYENGGDNKPQADDLLVFDDGAYGHVAIISEVGDDWVEVVQQNSEVPRERYELEVLNGKYTISGEKKPAGWLRLAFT